MGTVLRDTISFGNWIIGTVPNSPNVIKQWGYFRIFEYDGDRHHTLCQSHGAGGALR
jgi:hypothetical protein